MFFIHLTSAYNCVSRGGVGSSLLLSSGCGILCNGKHLIESIQLSSSASDRVSFKNHVDKKRGEGGSQMSTILHKSYYVKLSTGEGGQKMIKILSP